MVSVNIMCVYAIQLWTTLLLAIFSSASWKDIHPTHKTNSCSKSTFCSKIQECTPACHPLISAPQGASLRRICWHWWMKTDRTVFRDNAALPCFRMEAEIEDGMLNKEELVHTGVCHMKSDSYMNVMKKSLYLTLSEKGSCLSWCLY